MRKHKIHDPLTHSCVWKQSSPGPCFWNNEVCHAQDTQVTILLIRSWKLLSLHGLFDPLSSFLFSLTVMRWLRPVNTFTLQVDLSENKFYSHINSTPTIQTACCGRSYTMWEYKIKTCGYNLLPCSGFLKLIHLLFWFWYYDINTQCLLKIFPHYLITTLKDLEEDLCCSCDSDFWQI